MKCVKNTDGKIKRVTDETANTLVNSGKYQYCSRAEWKKEVRDKN